MAAKGAVGQGSGQGSGLKAGDTRTVVSLDDNRLAAAVLGQHDANLALIEQLLGVTAVAHGNMITLTGSGSACASARKVIEALYARAAKGETIAAGDVDGLIRHSRSAPAQEGMAQIRTRQKIVTARTPMQGQYIRALERSDLVFGLGPAGTGKTYLAVAFAAQCLEKESRRQNYSVAAGGGSG